MRTVQGPTDRVVVVGAGLGGLACALHLAGQGRQVTVVERELLPGGRAGRLSVDGYAFDTGPTVLTMPELIDEALGAVGEKLTDWVELDTARPGVPGLLPGRLHPGRAHRPDADGRRGLPRLRSPRGRRLPAFRRLRPPPLAAGARRLHRPQPRRPHRPAHRQPATPARRRRLPPPADQDRPVLPRPAYPADLLLPGHVRRAGPARRARHLHRDRVPRLGRRGLLPARRHPRRLPRAGRRRREARRAVPVRHHGRAGRDRVRPGHRGDHHRRRADRAPTWWCSTRTCRSPTGTCCRRPAGASCATPPPASCCTSARSRATSRSPTTTSTSAGPGRAPSTR